MGGRPEEDPRRRLVDAGVRLLERDGPEALNARRLAAEIGASTMAVYTHFGGMAGLHEAVVQEEFVRFGRHLHAVARTDDPVADLLALGLAYRDFVLADPRRYRFMIGLTGPGAHPPIGRDLVGAGTPAALPEVNAAFEQHVETVRRIMAAGRIRRGAPVPVAAQLWSMLHGFVLLETIGVFGHDGVVTVLAPAAVNLLVGLGDRREAAETSLRSLAANPKAPAPAPAPQVRRGRRPRT
ncbi:TetR/AcrR family transcriptional regulator [Actinomadura sp. GTD37]|uniref:TetR/AcrR family transcriptional regulator n=1 Tax=Actinomadura sp. GTD37 TaxID=1778030 RepID=UPI0035C1599A